MIEYPVTLELTASMQQEERKWIAADSHGRIEAGIPPAFDGEADTRSAEGLYGHALLNCYLATFRKMSEHHGIEYEQIDADGTVTVERGENGRPWVAAMDLSITVTTQMSIDTIGSFHETVLDNCFIHNSVKTEIDTSLTVETPSSTS